MLNKIFNKIQAYQRKKTLENATKNLLKKRQEFIQNGQIPWSNGYKEFKTESITNSINNQELLTSIQRNKLPEGYGYRLDERIVEYPWIIAHLSDKPERILDAGSTFNFDFVVNHDRIEKKDLTIYTFSPEKNCFNDKGVSYVYGDLRLLPFKDNWFDTIVSQSTIEHIDMDNAMYGYEIDRNEDETKKSYEYLGAVKEMVRVLNHSGTLLITFPFGKFENHGFFQQFDKQMLNKLLDLLKPAGRSNCTFFKYNKDGWVFSDKDALANTVSYNPHTGKGKLDDNAAHCRSVVCIKFVKF